MYILPATIRLLRDWEDFSDKDIPGYFEKAYAIFFRRMDALRRRESAIGPEEEKELHFMLDALIEARNTLAQ